MFPLRNSVSAAAKVKILCNIGSQFLDDVRSGSFETARCLLAISGQVCELWGDHRIRPLVTKDVPIVAQFHRRTLRARGTSCY